MKKFLLLMVLATAAGCGQNPRFPAVSEENVIVDEAAVSAEIEAKDEETEREAQRRAGLLTLNEAVKGFKVIHKRFPASLNEVVDQGMLHSLPDLPAGTIFTYDPATGEVALKDLNIGNAAEEAKEPAAKETAL